MIVRAFKTYNPINILWLIIMLFVLRIVFFVHAPDHVNFKLIEPFARVLIPANYEQYIGIHLNIFLAAVVVLIQAVTLNYMVNHYNLLGKPSFLPALGYITLTALFAPFMVLSQPLLCNFLLLWMLFKMLDFYKSDSGKSASYDLGMIVAAGTLIYFPFIFLFLIIWIALVIFRPFNWREWVAGIFGYATVFFFLAVYYYLTDRFHGFYNIWEPLKSKFPNHINIDYYNYLVLIPVIVILLLCIIKLRENFFRSYVHVRKAFQLLFFIFIISGLCFYTRAEFNLNHFLLCAVPASVFFAYYFLYANTKWFFELLYFILFAAIIYFQFNIQV
ncbi:MAG: DUF6427 family protein [Mucilaginibacter sp.]